MSVSRSLLLTCAFALAVSGCDRQSTPPAQPQESASPASQAAADAGQLSGKLDRSSAGKPMPAGSVKDPSGKTLSLASLKGKPVLLNLWATWCAPCVVEMPKLDGLAADMKGKLPVMTVSEDLNGATSVPPFFSQKGYKNLPQWLDPTNTLVMSYGGAALPLTVLYDSRGKEVWRVMGGYDWSSPEARKNIEDALKAA